LLADSQRRLDQIEDALRSVNTGLAISAEKDTPFWDAELQRVKGEIFLQMPDRAEKEAEDDAEALFRTAIETARDQQARSLELRAAMSLARLWQRQGKRDEACALVQPVYDWFTEGFDTTDLKAARALLEELA
jgi:predicted ATPase